MEQELFSWTGWDGDQECMTFYEVTLKQAIGDYLIGTEFHGANILQNEGKGKLQFYRFKEDCNEVEIVAEFTLHYRVGEKV